MSNSLVSFTKGALASRIVVGLRGTGELAKSDAF